MDSYEKAYTPKEISLTLDIGDSTLRKWCIALENQGYQFIRNDQNKRVFVDANIVVLRHFKELVQNHSMQLNNAAMLVVDRFGKGTFSQGTDIVPAENIRDLDRSNDKIIAKLMNYIEQQEERFEKQEQFNRTLLERLDQQQQYIEERLNKRDETLVQSLREVQETRKLIAAAEEKREEESKKGFLQRLFGK
ncbi:DUF3967 domain-containing protein [Metabacillus niabensis]|uniref:DUF3967 domain-containing protein n=1 Tax=Metabacillus niabensis TaxID=324854 RepID=UPI001CF9A366|nr:DUF3967 domain-containing protein [Metabacillus niabensis]